ncbi:hypothetical protein NKH77_33655 [Streptomyces sp. M19]
MPRGSPRWRPPARRTRKVRGADGAGAAAVQPAQRVRGVGRQAAGGGRMAADAVELLGGPIPSRA